MDKEILALLDIEFKKNKFTAVKVLLFKKM